MSIEAIIAIGSFFVLVAGVLYGMRVDQADGNGKGSTPERDRDENDFL